jgi:predicted kinase
MRTLVLLVGPKGAGKTRIAAMLADVFGAHAVPVEAMWLDRLARAPRGHGEAARTWEREGFDAVIDHALGALDESEVVVLDTTATSEHTPHLLARLASSGALVVVRVAATPARCTARALARDAAGQIPTSPERLAAINELAGRVSLAFDASFDNEGPWRELEARAWWHDLLVSRGADVAARVPTLETPRLLLRAWLDADLAPFAALNADPAVMEHFERPLGEPESDALAGRIRRELARRGAGLWGRRAARRRFALLRGLLWPLGPDLRGPVPPCRRGGLASRAERLGPRARDGGGPHGHRARLRDRSAGDRLVHLAAQHTLPPRDGEAGHDA